MSADYCPFEPSEPRCRECRGKPCGDSEADDRAADADDTARGLEQTMRLALGVQDGTVAVEWRDPDPITEFARKDALARLERFSALGR